VFVRFSTVAGSKGTCHAAKHEPDRGFPQAQTAHDNFRDFASLMPASAHMLMWIKSDRAIPRSFRFMEGFGVHTFRLVNDAGRSTYVKFHRKPAQRLESVMWNEAVRRPLRVRRARPHQAHP